MHLSLPLIGSAIVRAGSISQGRISPSRALTRCSVVGFKRNRYMYSPATSSLGDAAVKRSSKTLLCAFAIEWNKEKAIERPPRRIHPLPSPN